MAFGKFPDGKDFNCIGVVFKMDHLTPHKEPVTKIKKKRISNFFFPASDAEALELIFEDISEMKVRNLLRFKAITGCYKNGFINKIGFVNTLEDEEKPISTEDSALVIPDNTLEKIHCKTHEEKPSPTEGSLDPVLTIPGYTHEEKHSSTECSSDLALAIPGNTNQEKPSLTEATSDPALVIPGNTHEDNPISTKSSS